MERLGRHLGAGTERAARRPAGRGPRRAGPSQATRPPGLNAQIITEGRVRHASRAATRSTRMSQDAVVGWSPRSSAATWRSGSASRPRACAELGGTALWLSLWLIHSRSRRFTGGSAVRAGQERWRTVVNSDAQYSKASEGASLHWVQSHRHRHSPAQTPVLTVGRAGASCALVSFGGLSS